MFSTKDLEQIEAKGIEVQTVESQIQYFVNGFPWMNLTRAATPKDGILQLSDEQIQAALDTYETYVPTLRIVKFVPASGAATRMFKSLFGFLEGGKSDKSVDQFFERLPEFAFYDDLKAALAKDGLDIETADQQTIAAYFLTGKGLDYGSLPKGLLKFHRYAEENRTPVEEHLVEGASYARSKGEVAIHFTVSPEHKAKFKELISEQAPEYAERHNLNFVIDFSEQKASTDTIAVNLDNTPFVDKNGGLLFRPAGHGALLANLNDVEADLVFIKNIDNVVPDRLKNTTTIYKRAIAGTLLQTRERIFGYLNRLDSGDTSQALMAEIDEFLRRVLCVEPVEGFYEWPVEKVVEYFRTKLNRPIRVCGMVQNVGEPGGGPFWAKSSDGTSQLQVVESAQVDMDDEEQKNKFLKATHFNPVDLVCSWTDYTGKAFDLLKYRDPQTGFITQKSKDGKDLKAQELPGLWNGSMSDWNTLFVEVPLITFNPVKTVNDLLRDEHKA
ncbi:NAD metabolism ATPase/kinase [Siphonobacter sp. BAB-5385]|uniref:DUF4301 family protein n=1 Tax=unclassified Siphonobacter TaxID=2635712 RepID=UPI000B9EC5F1|nr:MULTISPECIES: DUF4301 family protein [unclassified Siphonobacter]OZI06344.1 NAD metabolism ATPase/kinase [Siphonobacter sp. BAB-5385]PMD96108.1 NAD metabolism ATPase/kinase [Siphonobacter sp. BAB-5405]